MNSVGSENPGPFMLWFSQELQANVTKIQSQIPELARETIEQMVLESLQKKRPVWANGLELDAGVATYNRWKNIPTGGYFRRTGGGINTRLRWVTETSKLTLPNWHQPYIRFRVRREQPRDYRPGGKYVNRNWKSPHPVPRRPSVFTIKCINKQELDDDQVFVMVAADGRTLDLSQLKGFSPTNIIEMRKGDAISAPRNALEKMAFTSKLEVFVFERDSATKNELLAYASVGRDEQFQEVLKSGRLLRKSKYRLTLDTRLSTLPLSRLSQEARARWDRQQQPQ